MESKMEHPNTKIIHVPEHSKEFSYFLGLCASDGNVYKYSIRIELQRRDEEVLKQIGKWADTLGWKCSVVPSKEGKYIKLSINSKILVGVFNQYGITPAKSKIIRLVKPEYPDQYLRGYFDGNGTITLRRNGMELTFHSGSEFFIHDINIWINSILGSGIKTVNKHDSIWRISYYGRQAIKLADYLWEEPILNIPRKYKIYKSYIKIRNPRFWTDDQLIYLKENYQKNTDSWKRIAKELGKSDKSVSCMIAKLKLNR